MKKLYAWVLSLALLASLGACTNYDDQFEALKSKLDQLEKATTPQEITLPATIYVPVGMEIAVNYQIKPYAANGNEITWTSSNPSVVKVSEQGVLKGIQKGTATVTAKIGNLEASAEIQVMTNELTIDEHTEPINCAIMYQSSSGAGFRFGVAHLTDEQTKFTDAQFAWNVDLPFERLNETLDISQDCDGSDWSFYGDFYDAKNETLVSYDYGTGTMTVQLVDKSQNIYTIIVDIIIDSHSVKIQYTGVMDVTKDYGDVDID